MAASFPTSIKSYTTKTDGVDYPTAAHVNSYQEEIVALETLLGVNGISWITEGVMLNGKISVTVVANDLVVAIKTMAGADPSASSPVYVRINGTMRKITAALSVTKADGTNWFNSGSPEIAAKEVDYFVYLIWNTTPATDIVDIGFSRRPHFTVYSEVSGTTTNDKYLAFGNASTPTSTDDMVVVGRFSATISASGGGHVWTVPTFTTTNLIQRPIYETRNLFWTPTWTNLTVGNGTNNARYQIKSNVMRLSNAFVLGSTSSVSGSVGTTMPMTCDTAPTNGSTIFSLVRFLDSGTNNYIGVVGVDASALTFFANNSAGTYLSQTSLSSTIPFTWAINDAIVVIAEYWI